MNLSREKTFPKMIEPASLDAIAAVVRPHLKFLPDGETLEPLRDLGELGLDSMASIDLLLDLEKAFSITISDDELTENSFLNLEEIRKLLAQSAD